MGTPKKKEKSARQVTKDEFGFDYGFPPESLLISPPDFPQLLTEADTFAVAYGHEVNSMYGPIPALTLVGRHAAPLKTAFEEFKRWTDASDGDSVELSFLILKRGGYAIGVSPEINRLRIRILGFNSVYQPLYFSPMWIKILDTCNPLVSQFREYCQKLISPFTLRAAVYRGVTPGQVPDSALFEQLPGTTPILKFCAHFADEGEASPDTLPGIIEKSFIHKDYKRTQKRSPKPPPRNIAPSDVSQTRLKMLAKHFPVTLLRLRTNVVISAIRRSLMARGVGSWQIDQAVCNLQLSFEMTKGQPHFKNIPSNEFVERLVASLSNRFEEANGTHDQLNKVTDTLILAQIMLDSTTLLRRLGIRSKHNDISALLNELSKNGLLTTSDKEAERAFL